MNQNTEPKIQLPKKGPTHHGQNIKRIRLLLGIQQKEIAYELGAGWTQKKVSRIECSVNVQLSVRKILARLFDVDVELFNDFDEAAGRMAIVHMMKSRRQMQQLSSIDNQTLLEDITDLLDSASFSIQRERQNMQLLLRLLQQAKRNAVAWKDSLEQEDKWEVREPRVVGWRVA